MDTPGEDQSVAQVVDRLAAKFPDLPRERVRAVVDEEHDRFAGNPVRAYVPVLVERQAKDRLRTAA